MPSKSASQARLMAAVAHGWRPDDIVPPPKAVAKEFFDADMKRQRSAASQLRKFNSRPIRPGQPLKPIKPRGF